MLSVSWRAFMSRKDFSLFPIHWWSEEMSNLLVGLVEQQPILEGEQNRSLGDILTMVINITTYPSHRMILQVGWLGPHRFPRCVANVTGIKKISGSGAAKEGSLGWHKEMVEAGGVSEVVTVRFGAYEGDLLGQWLSFKLFGITYLVGKIKFKLLFQGPLAKWVNSSPLKSFNPKSKIVVFPTIHFQGRAVKLRGCSQLLLLLV